MIPARSDVTTSVLSLLGDTQVAGGSIYTAAFQAAFLNLAYQEMLSRLSVASADKVQRESYYVLPLYTGALAPVTAGISNFGFPEEIRERSITGTYGISAVTPASPSAGRCSVTLSSPLPASVVSGQTLELYSVGGMSDDINDSWSVTVTDTTHIILEGCTATGTFTSGGTVVYAGSSWSDPLEAFDTTDQFPENTVESELAMYAWQKSVIRFPPCNTQRELKIVYKLSGSVGNPGASTDSMGIDDSLNFLAHRTAQLAGASKGSPRVPTLLQQADYHLGVLLAGAALALQAGQPIVPPLFRGKRNTRWAAW